MGYQNKNRDFPQMVRETGFKLRQYRDGPLDWRLMGSYETERILREQNFELVDKALVHLSEAPLGTVLETHILDSGIAKYFVMSQYAIQYLLYCRTYLDELVADLQEVHAAAQQEIANLHKALSDSNHEVVQLHKKITQIETIREVVYPCHLCTKNFISNESLNIHIGRKHHVGSPVSLSQSGVVKDKDKFRDNDMQLINAIKMELEIKQLKERLNAAERNIRERGSKRLASSTDVSSPRLEQRTVGIQSNLVEEKEMDELKSDSTAQETNERKEQLHGLADKLQHFEAWQMQLKQSNEQFIQDINQKLEGLSQALEQNKQNVITDTATASTEEHLATPRLQDLERILTEKVTEIGKVSASKLEEVVHHLEMGYKDKLDALERELKQLNTHRDSNDPEIKPTPISSITNVSKIPKPVINRKENRLEHIKQQVEQEFIENKRDDDTYSIEEQPKPSVTQVQVHITKQPPMVSLAPNKLNTEIREASDSTDISESLSQEEDDKAQEQSLSEEGSETLSSDRESSEEKQKTPSSPIKPAIKLNSKPLKPMTRKDMRKLVSRKLSPHGFDMKSKHISHMSLKKLNAELAENRNNLKLQYPNFYATRNRIRKFVEKLCSAKLPQHAEVLLKHKTPLQPIEVPKGRAKNFRTVTTDEDDLEDQLDQTDNSAVSSSRSSSPQRQVSHDFKAHLEQILVKPAGASKPSLSSSGNSNPNTHGRPVPLPRKRVMFDTLSSGRSFNEHD